MGRFVCCLVTKEGGIRHDNFPGLRRENAHYMLLNAPRPIPLAQTDFAGEALEHGLGHINAKTARRALQILIADIVLKRGTI